MMTPVTARERVELLDVVRGFALFGVLFANLSMIAQDFLTSRGVLPTEEIDTILRTARAYLVSGRFYTLFTLLFGVGLAVQMARAEERGSAVAPVYARRLIWLFVIGYLHLMLLWWGDILIVYALAGFLLLALRGRGDRTLIGLAVVLVSTPHAVIAAVHSMRAHDVRGAAEGPSELEGLLATVADGGYPEWIVANLATFWEYFESYLIIFPEALGLFLFGYWAGRRRYFQDASAHLPFFHQLLRRALPVSLAGMAVQAYQVSAKIGPLSPWYVPFSVLSIVSVYAHALVYLSILVLLFHQPASRRVLLPLAPFGRMALTNYLLHSVFYFLLFSGVGLGQAGKIGYSACVPIALGVFLVQVAFSTVWLRYFRFGPMEWLWRSLTYGKRQPWRAGEGRRGRPGCRALGTGPREPIGRLPRIISGA